jgi:hypothetical protein
MTDQLAKQVANHQSRSAGIFDSKHAWSQSAMVAAVWPASSPVK